MIQKTHQFITDEIECMKATQDIIDSHSSRNPGVNMQNSSNNSNQDI